MSGNQRLAMSFNLVRVGVQGLEEAVEQNCCLSDEEEKEFDKAIVLIKLGAKMIKKGLKARGHERPGRRAKGNP